MMTLPTFEIPTSIPFHYHVNKWDEDYDTVTTIRFFDKNTNECTHIEILGEVPKRVLPESMKQFFPFHYIQNEGCEPEEVLDETFFKSPSKLEMKDAFVEIDVRDYPTKWVRNATTNCQVFIDTFKYYESN